MKKIISFLVLTMLNGSVFAAQIVPKKDLKNYTKKERVSVANVRGGKSKAVDALKAEVNKKGGEYMYISSLGTPGDSSHWRGTAIVLEKK
ncbi:DUF1471 domain-containing protein [Erwinia tracheiphila]|nr:DUF1471 domain-containing protein [Erwinia tracheiphila]EOS95754.1 hypothetical protein ETR_06585 [Erwinia tracheiphila PSU-1]UIA82880.1 DUF1471 domain-containing protein [Erwinia tracheiphila]UIA88838.1 DUF1471 domain-containing protein [Erwinia tracheiphila]UIA91468.1 DUF1471 domain-containing protein [Erwinia tracheiphila]UIA97219.1 DUF1471 domain-containing protein [Erwinia tracheiphila]